MSSAPATVQINVDRSTNPTTPSPTQHAAGQRRKEAERSLPPCRRKGAVGHEGSPTANRPRRGGSDSRKNLRTSFRGLESCTRRQSFCDNSHTSEVPYSRHVRALQWW